jgi:hypothetical protein
MTTAARVSRPESIDGRIRTGGWVLLVGALLGAASGLYLAVIDPVVSEDRFSYPLSASGFTWIQLWFGIQHLALVVGLLALWSTGAVGPSRSGRIGHLVAVVGMLGLAATEVLAIGARDDGLDSALVGVLNGLYGITSIAIGVGLVTEGLAVRKHGAWTGWRAWIVLALGVWVFVPMTPAIALSVLGARLAISAWMLLFAVLGLALVAGTRESS